MQRVVITGAAGDIGSALRQRLARTDRQLVAVDLRPLPDADSVSASVTDLDAMRAAVRGAHAVLHLAGIRSEAPWEEIAATNIDGTRTVLEACRREEVRRVLLASSIHAVGAATIGEVRGIETPQPRPVTYYGVSKVAVEALGSLYADRFGMAIVSARIGTAEPEPSGVRSLATWPSPGDLARLAEAVIARHEPGHRVVWGVSANTRGWVSHAAGERIGFHPQDDAERFAHRFDGARDLPERARLGAGFFDRELGIRDD